MLHFGILAGQDETLEIGDYVTDPFNVLNVSEVYIDKEFAVLFNDIDYNKLVDCTANFDRIDWDQYIQYLKFPEFAMLYNDEEVPVMAFYSEDNNCNYETILNYVSKGNRQIKQ